MYSGFPTILPLQAGHRPTFALLYFQNPAHFLHKLRLQQLGQAYLRSI